MTVQMTLYDSYMESEAICNLTGIVGFSKRHSRQNGAVEIKPASRNLLILLMWHLDRCREGANHTPRPHQTVLTNPSI